MRDNKRLQIRRIALKLWLNYNLSIILGAAYKIRLVIPHFIL